MYIAIDSAENMTYTGVISGNVSDIYNVYSGFITTFKKRGVNPPFHWRKISRDVKYSYSCMKEVAQAINDSKLLINILRHKRAPEMERKIVFYELLPQYISLKISPWVKELEGKMVIDVDDDYRLGEHNNTSKFLISLIESLCYDLTGIQIYSRKVYDTIRATIKQKKGILEFYGNVVDSNSSNGVQIIDMILGYVIQGDCKDFDRRKLHRWDIFRK
jgi:uncharacterized protein (UPF0297 family)